MAFSLSPAVDIQETNLTTIVPAVSTSIGAIVGEFQWGPVEEITLVDNEVELVRKFEKPTTTIYKDWFCASNFLSYSNNLKVVRVVGSSAVNAVQTGSTATNLLVKNSDDFNAQKATLDGSDVEIIAKYPGSFGNNITVAYADNAGYTTWAYKNYFDRTPDSTKEEVHFVVLVDGNVVEKFTFSKNNSEVDYQGRNYSAEEVINRGSAYVNVVWANFVSDGSGGYKSLASDGVALTSGNDDSPVDSDYQIGWDLFAIDDAVDINLCIVGGASATVGQYVIQNVCEVRKDCFACVSPQESEVVNNAAPETAINSGTRTTLGSSTYGMLDGNYKYQYDKYNDVYVWVPFNGDIAGLCARTDQVSEPWFSPGGLNRGQIKNVVKLAFNPNKSQRDELYKNEINPIVSFPGEGVVLFGDKTLSNQPSAFDRVNVRRLFIVLEKAISTAAKYMLFEINDAFTRRRFVSMVEPYLRQVQAKRGVTDFKVVADETNNTGQVIDSNEFVGDIYIKPSHSINYITLNFVAVRTDVTFEEIIGA